MLLPKVLNLISLKNVARPLLIQTRNYPGMKHEVYDYINWVRPAKIPSTKPEKSGDLSPMDKIDNKSLLRHFELSKELEDADDLVKAKFTVGLSKRREAVDIYVDQMIKKVQRHESDYGSMEAKLARMTGKIRAGQDALEQDPKNKKMKQKLKELIEKRKKYMKFLRRYDYRRFEYILDRLDIKYVPYPDSFHWIARKDCMRTLTRRLCSDIKAERLDAYKEMLQNQQLSFLETKVKNLDFIRSEQIACKIPVTVSQKEIDDVKKQYDLLKIKREEEAEIRRSNEVRDDYEIKL